MEYNGINKIGDDAYFIRLKDNKTHYLHPDKTIEDDENIGYRVKEGNIGAGIWHKRQALNIIEFSGAKNLEIVRVKDVLGSDGSSN